MKTYLLTFKFCVFVSGVKCVHTSSGQYPSLGRIFWVWCQFSSIFFCGSHSTTPTTAATAPSAAATTTTGSPYWPTFESTSQKGPGASPAPRKQCRSPICHVGMRYGTKPWSIFIFNFNHLIWLCQWIGWRYYYFYHYQSKSLRSCKSSTVSPFVVISPEK